ncbi:MAG: hypothetical protein ACHQ4H_16450 [Ktedonobacterales bacterium]
MGKFLDKLRQVSQVSSSGMGFLGARTPAQKPRPAAILVTLSTADVAAAEAVAKAGADVVIVTDWRPSADITQFKAALGNEAAGLVWGIDLRGAENGTAGALQSAQTAGASFAILGREEPASVLVAARQLETFELVIAVEPPADDLGLVMLRAENLLPAVAALLRTQFSPAEISKLTVGGFTRLRLLNESLRFPVLVPVTEAPDEAQTRLLVRLGIHGIVLPGTNTSGASLAAQIQALKEHLEQAPTNDDDRPGVAIGGLMGAHTPSLEPDRTQPDQPPHEPGEE